MVKNGESEEKTPAKKQNPPSKTHLSRQRRYNTAEKELKSRWARERASGAHGSWGRPSSKAPAKKV